MPDVISHSLIIGMDTSQHGRAVCLGHRKPACRTALLALLWLGLLGGANPAGARDTNIAPYCKVRSIPYMGAGIAYLTDGRIASPADSTLMLGAPLGPRIGTTSLQYEFVFPGRMAVTGVRLFQSNSSDRRPAAQYVIEIDREGNGQYDQRVVTESRGRGGEWVMYQVSPPVVGYGLRFRTIRSVEDIGSNYGPPAIEEFEILADSDLPKLPQRVLLEAPLLGADTAHAKDIDIKGPSEAVTPGASFRRGLFGSMWLYWSPGHEYSEQGNDGKLALLQRLKVNRYWLYPGVYVPRSPDLPDLTLPQDPDYLYFVNRQVKSGLTSGSKEVRILPFPSQVVPGYRENVLRRFVAQMHKSGVRVVANEFLLPYGLKSWDFPRVADPYVYPSVLSSSFVREGSTTLYKEFMQAGVDGLALGGDEFFLRAAAAGVDEDVSPICRDARGLRRDICKPQTRELFKQRFGSDAAAPRGTFSSTTAKWQVFQYEQLASLFAHYAEMMKSIEPGAIVTSLFRPGEENRPHFGIAYDIMGWLGAVTEMSSDPYWSHNSYLGHYYFANEAKKLLGASRARMATITLQTTPRFDRDGYRDPIMVYGPAFSALMHGITGINFYKQDYLFAGGTNDAGPWVEKFFKLTAFLEGKGLQDYRVPKAVALVYSRASEDWWQLAHTTDPVQAPQAMVYQNAVMEVLFRNGIPFDLYYLDQSSSLEKLGEYQAAILAYPYSITKGAMDRIRKAMTQGTKVLALWRFGEVDEYGAAYPAPLLRDIPGVEHLAIDLTRSDYAEFSAKLLPMLRKDLGGQAPLNIDAAGRDVECSIMEKRDGRMLFCLNWEKQPVDVNVGINLPEGRYAASAITMQHENPARISGRSALSASDLGQFRLALAPGEARVIIVTPVAAAPAPPK